MRISVVVPCFNAQEFLVETLLSVLGQQLPVSWDMQLVVVDDGSTDRTGALLATLDHAALTVLHQTNRGNVAARNLALENVTGDVVAFCDADDVWYPGKLIAQLEALGDDAIAACCAARYLSPGGDELATKGLGLDGGSVHRLLVEDYVMPVPLSGWLFRGPAALLRMDEGLPVGADFDLALRSARLGRVAYVPRALVGYRVHPASITSSRLVTQQQVRRFLMARHVGDPAAEAGFAAWVDGRSSPWRERVEDFSARQVRRGADAWASGTRGRAGVHFLVAVATSPRSAWRKARRVGL